jgi:hypothetical protein
MPRVIAIIVGAGKATLHELQTVYGVKDAYDLLEVIAIDSENERRMIEHARKHRG